MERHSQKCNYVKLIREKIANANSEASVKRVGCKLVQSKIEQQRLWCTSGIRRKTKTNTREVFLPAINNQIGMSCNPRPIGDLVERYYRSIPGELCPGVVYSFPLQEHLSMHRVGECLRKLEFLIFRNFDEIVNQICANSHVEGYGGVPIQADRYTMDFDFGEKFDETPLWSWFSDRTGFCQKEFSLIVQLAEEHTANMIGATYCRDRLGVYSLIMTKDMDDQGMHLDLARPGQIQFAMHVSAGQASTVVFEEEEPASPTSLSELLNLVNNGIETFPQQAAHWMKCATSLQTNIDSRYKGEYNSKGLLADGFGKLFQFQKYGHKMNKSHSKRFEWSSLRMLNCPQGTVYKIPGGTVHCGSGNSKDCPGEVRTILFWTYTEEGESPYNKDTQHTRLSMMLTVTMDCWDKAKPAERRELLYLVYYCYVTSEESYLQSAPSTFGGFPNIKKFLIALNRKPETFGGSEVGTESNKLAVENLVKRFAKADFCDNICSNDA